MSKRLRVLESVVGATLLVRSPRGVTLTPAGEQLYTAAQRVLAGASAVRQLIRARSTPPVARLASSPTAAEQRLPAVLALLATQLPAFAADLTTANSWVVRELVRDGRCELGLVASDGFLPRSDGLHQRRLWNDEIVLAVPAGHRWQRVRDVPVDEFIAEPLIERDPWAHSTRLVSVVLGAVGLTRVSPRAQLGSTQAILAGAEALSTPALVSAASVVGIAGRGLAIRRVAGLSFKRHFALVWSGSISSMSTPAQAIADYLTVGFGGGDNTER